MKPAAEPQTQETPEQTKIKSVLCVAAATAAFGLCAVMAGEKAAGAKEKATCSKEKMACEAKGAKLLKGVVHLSDDDVRFRTAKGLCVFVDPVNGPEKEIVQKTGATRPDLILITHSHGDHFQPGVISAYLKTNPDALVVGPADVVETLAKKSIAKATAVAPGQTHTIAGVTFETLPAYFSKGDSHPKTKNWVGYVLQLNGARYYVTGDTEPLPEMASAKATVVFPLLFGCGGNTDLALKMAGLSGAPVVVPVHHSNQIGTIAKFVGQLPEGVASGYFADGTFVAGSEMPATAAVASAN